MFFFIFLLLSLLVWFLRRMYRDSFDFNSTRLWLRLVHLRHCMLMLFIIIVLIRLLTCVAHNIATWIDVPWHGIGTGTHSDDYDDDDAMVFWWFWQSRNSKVETFLCLSRGGGFVAMILGLCCSSPDDGAIMIIKIFEDDAHVILIVYDYYYSSLLSKTVPPSRIAGDAAIFIVLLLYLFLAFIQRFALIGSYLFGIKSMFQF